MKRRQFLKTAATVPLAGFSMHPLIAADFPVVDLDRLFEASSPEVLALAKRVMEKCVLAMIRPPQPRHLNALGSHPAVLIISANGFGIRCLCSTT